jgi:hypothetical protein
MGGPDMHKATGHWGLSGPGWAAEWNQGGESGFLSIACAAEDDKAEVSKEVEIPVDGQYRVWVRYRDARGGKAAFSLQIEQGGATALNTTFGQQSVIDDDSEEKLYWNWSFAWDRREAKLKAGPAKLVLAAGGKQDDCRQVDCVVLTTDERFHPTVKDHPSNPAWRYLDQLREQPEQLAKLEPLARRAALIKEPPSSWAPRTFADRGFLYLWKTDATAPWTGSDAKRILYPYGLSDAAVKKAFEERYGGQKEVPIFSDPRIVPVFPTLASACGSAPVQQWLNQSPQRSWAINGGFDKLTPDALKNFQAGQDRFVGQLAREQLGHFAFAAEDTTAINAAKSRRQFAEALGTAVQHASAAAMKASLGDAAGDQPYRFTISCCPVGNTIVFPLAYLWGARAVGNETAVMPGGPLAMRWAFLRGAARQNQGFTATMRFFRFGDSVTVYSEVQGTARPRNILDNYYSVFSGPGATWCKLDTWYQYMAGSALFFHPDANDEYWLPGGGAAGQREIQLSPTGKVIDHFLRVTASRPQRGSPLTPVAFLVDYAHGWEPAPYEPRSFHAFGGQPRQLPYGLHEQMLQEYFNLAFHPAGPLLGEPTTALNQTFVPGVFGDIFDVIYAYPDVNRWGTIDTYPAVIVAGDIELTQAEGQRLNQYVEKGGTLLVALDQLSGPGLAELKLPVVGKSADASSYRWLSDSAVQPSQKFRFQPVPGGKALATAEGQPICASFDRGQGRLILLGISRGLGVDRQASPIVARLIAHLSRGLMPVEVRGRVEWMVNQTEQGYLVTIINPAGQNKPQQGIVPTDYRANQEATIVTSVPIKKAEFLLGDTTPPSIGKEQPSQIRLTIPAGGVRIVSLTR